MFTKQHYGEVARILKSHIDRAIQTDDNDRHIALIHVVDSFVLSFIRDNPAFDISRFSSACGVVED